MEKTIEVFEDRIGPFEKRIQRFNKRAVRNGLPQMIMTKSERKYKKATKEYGRIGTLNSDFFVTKNYPYYEVSLVGSLPKLEGDWKIKAVLKHTKSGTMIYGTEVSEKYRKQTQKCDHCHTNRRRVTTVIIENDKDELKQVGKECLKVYCPTIDLKNLIWWAESTFRLLDENEPNGTYTGVSTYDTRDFLLATSIVIRQLGWKSKREKNPTANIVWDWLESGKNIEFHMNPTQEDKDLVDAILKWGPTIEDNFGYLGNLKTVLASEVVENKTYGIAASAIVAYRRAQKEKEEKEIKSKSEWIGELGKREKFQLKLEIIHGFNTNYGYIHIIKFVDLKGNVAVWFTSTDTYDYEVGQLYQVTGTVKDHSVYNEEKQTKLTRCKLVQRNKNSRVAE